MVKVIGIPIHKKWYQFWKLNIILAEGKDFKMDGYAVKVTSPSIRHNYRIKVYGKRIFN